MDYDWIVNEENITKNKPLSNLPPITNSNSQILLENVNCNHQYVETISKEPDESKTIYKEQNNKKLPISFISPKDWQKYLHFTNLLAVNSERKNFEINQGGKNGRILRLLNSFHKLYQEYSQLFASSSLYAQNQNDTSKSSQLLNHRIIHQSMSSGIQCGDNVDSFDSADENLVEVAVQTILTMKQIKIDNHKFIKKGENVQKDFENVPEMSLSLVPWGMRNIINPAKKLGHRLKQIAHNNSRAKSVINDIKYFDKIDKLEGNTMLEVMEETHQQSIMCHKISLINIDRNKFKLPNVKYLQVPLAIELLLPKIQLKIESILNDCPFLCDPLEVAAELRHFGYDQSACIKYFKMTKSLRSIIEEMMPISNTNVNCGYTNDTHLTNRSPSLLSNNSQIMSHDPTDASNETITALNSNANHYIGNTNTLKQMNMTFEQVQTPNKSISPFSENKISTVINSNITHDSLAMDCKTQTSLVHFYMDDKSMESIFYKIKHYLAIIRQLHSETRDEIEYLRKQLCCVFSSLKSHIALLINQSNENSISDEQKNKMVTLSRQVEELKLKLKKEEKKRRHAYNLMQEQMGNIRVYCRCRHVADGGSILEFIGSETITLPIAPNERFEFDKVFHPGMSQLDLYEEFRPLVMSFIDGYNVCFITYGGEASGKTFTLIGGNDGTNQQGLMQRALTTILMEERLRQRDWEYKITACVVEIYNDNCIDVLSGETNIQLYVDNGMETAYQKLKSVPITNEADAEALMQVCRVKRKVARTALNPASSRSHLITLIRLQGRSKIHGENICSFLCLCDLAGFEDIIKAETQTNKILSKEAGYINRSLTAFNRVFVSLRKQDPNTVSYRDTKLTHLLKPFLTNSGKCALVITVRNDKRSLGSTQNTLRFGRETRGVSLGKARRQVNLNSQVSVM